MTSYGNSTGSTEGGTDKEKACNGEENTAAPFSSCGRSSACTLCGRPALMAQRRLSDLLITVPLHYISRCCRYGGFPPPIPPVSCRNKKELLAGTWENPKGPSPNTNNSMRKNEYYLSS